MGGFENIIFDWDGVLSNSFSDQFLWFQKCCNALGKQFSFQDINEFRSVYEEPVYPKMYEKLGFDWSKEKDAIWKLYNEHKATTHIPLYDETKDILMHLYLMGAEMHIATSNTKAVVQKSIQENGLEDYFSTIITKEDLPVVNGQPKLKPYPDVLGLALDAFQGNASNTIIIGDQVSDLEANNRLIELGKQPLTAIAVTYGDGRKEDLAMARPNYLAHSVAELKDTLTRMIFPV